MENDNLIEFYGKAANTERTRTVTKSNIVGKWTGGIKLNFNVSIFRSSLLNVSTSDTDT